MRDEAENILEFISKENLNKMNKENLKKITINNNYRRWKLVNVNKNFKLTYKYLLIFVFFFKFIIF